MLIARDGKLPGVTVPDFAMPTFGADGYSTEIDSADQVLLMYSDVDGEREYEHDTLTVCQRLVFSVWLTATTPCSPADLERFADWVAGTRHYQHDMARFFEKHLNAAGN